MVDAKFISLRESVFASDIGLSLDTDTFDVDRSGGSYEFTVYLDSHGFDDGDIFIDVRDDYVDLSVLDVSLVESGDKVGVTFEADVPFESKEKVSFSLVYGNVDDERVYSSSLVRLDARNSMERL